MAINVIVQYNDRSLPDNWLCMAINISVVQYNGGLLPDFILLAQGYYPLGVPDFVLLSAQGYYPRGTRLNTM